MVAARLDEVVSAMLRREFSVLLLLVFQCVPLVEERCGDVC
jgi:hypothetical protein